MHGNTDAGGHLIEPFLKQFRTDRCGAGLKSLAKSFEETAFAIVKHHPQGDGRVKLLRNLLELRDITISQVSPEASQPPAA